MSTAPNRPRNSRTANGLKKELHIDWDTPKPKRKPEPKFDSIAFLNECIQDKEAYSEKERAAFRKIVAYIESLVLENEALREAEWDRRDIDGYEGALGKFYNEKE
jgi:hypothetical protein